jgi:cyclophilin family peptidyl-prolyl cis-trans isomerase
MPIRRPVFTFRSAKAVSALAGLEPLESRLALSGGPLPVLADLENPNDTVVRIETNYGDIDIELYNAAAPITVSNFLTYVKSGRFGDTFFHRSIASPTPFVLQGGGFSYTDAGGLKRVVTDPPIIRESTGKSNVARTVAMARTSDPVSATSQFFINYVNNTSLDNAGDDRVGYAVFGKVVKGWETVQAIEALQSHNLVNDPAFAGPDAGAFNDLPVNASFNSSAGVRQADLVALISAEIIKPATVQGFFTRQVFSPEGFRSGATTETVELFNPNGFSGAYQVTVHYELGQRDTVIAQGALGGNRKLSITLSDKSQPGLNTVRSGVGYSVQVDSAFPQSQAAAAPIAASSNRVDFNAAAGEAFFNPGEETRTNALKSWAFPRVEHNSLSREFIVYQNLTAQDATVTATFHSANSTFTATRLLGAYRRGGLEVFGFPEIPDGVLWISLSSTQDIVAAVSDWDLPAPGVAAANAYTPGWTAMGVANGGNNEGAYAGAQIRNNYSSIVSISNSATETANVTLNMWRASGTPTTRTLTLLTGERKDLVLDSTDLAIPADQFFSITYTSDNPVAVQYTSFDNVGRNQSTGKHSDGVSSAFEDASAPAALFADGRSNPTLQASQLTETISLFNPFAASTGQSFTYTVKFYFSDGTVISAASGQIQANSRVDLVSGNIAAVRNKVASNTSFRNYGIVVTGQAIGPADGTTNIAPVAVLTRWDTSAGRAIASGPMFSAAATPLGDPMFG